MINVEKFDLPFDEHLFRKLFLDLIDNNFAEGIKQTRRHPWYMVLLALAHLSIRSLSNTPVNKVNYYLFPILYIAAFGYYMYVFIQTRKQKKKSIQSIEDWISSCLKIKSHALAFNEENLILWEDEKKTIYKWVDFKEIKLNKNYLSLSKEIGMIHLFFPRAVFTKKDTYDQLIILAKKNTPEHTKNNHILESFIDK